MPDDHTRSTFMSWLDQHGCAVMKVARAYTLNGDDCQDLAQEILLQAWRSTTRFEEQSSPATWFYRVALHTAMNWRRKDKPRRSKQESLLEVHAVAADRDCREQLEHRETIEQLYHAIQQLPKAESALILLYLEEMSYKEMADVLGISESNVGVKLNRAKKALGTLMNGRTDEP